MSTLDLVKLIFLVGFSFQLLLYVGYNKSVLHLICYPELTHTLKAVTRFESTLIAVLPLLIKLRSDCSAHILMYYAVSGLS